MKRQSNDWAGWVKKLAVPLLFVVGFFTLATVLVISQQKGSQDSSNISTENKNEYIRIKRTSVSGCPECTFSKPFWKRHFLSNVANIYTNVHTEWSPGETIFFDILWAKISVIEVVWDSDVRGDLALLGSQDVVLDGGSSVVEQGQAVAAGESDVLTAGQELLQSGQDVFGGILDRGGLFGGSGLFSSQDNTQTQQETPVENAEVEEPTENTDASQAGIEDAYLEFKICANQKCSLCATLGNNYDRLLTQTDVVCQQGMMEGNQVQVFMHGQMRAVLGMFFRGTVVVGGAVRLTEIYHATDIDADVSENINFLLFWGYTVNGLTKVYDGFDDPNPSICYTSEKARGGRVIFDIPTSQITHVSLLNIQDSSSDLMAGILIKVCTIAMQTKCHPCGYLRETEAAKWGTVYCNAGFVEGNQIQLVHSYSRLQFCEINIFGLQKPAGPGVVTKMELGSTALLFSVFTPIEGGPVHVHWVTVYSCGSSLSLHDVGLFLPGSERVVIGLQGENFESAECGQFDKPSGPQQRLIIFCTKRARQIRATAVSSIENSCKYEVYGELVY